jgi:hypothetical protein
LKKLPALCTDFITIFFEKERKTSADMSGKHYAQISLTRKKTRIYMDLS